VIWQNTAIECYRLVDNNLLLTRAGEEHAVDFVTVWSVEHDWLAVESFYQDVLGLIQSTKDEIVYAEAAAAL